jgi:hypothetical protein
MRIPSSILPALLLLGGCVGGGKIDAPSLGLRAVEKQPVAMPDEAAEPQTPLDPALEKRIRAIESDAATGHAAFETARVRTAAAVDKAASAPAGSEPWTVAQQELSVLDAARGAVAHASAEIDALRIEPANASLGNRNAVEAAGQRMSALAQQESEVVAALSGRLKQ